VVAARVVTALGLTVGGNIWVAVIASDDPSFAIEENYYQRALQFDAQRGVEQRSDRLGGASSWSGGTGFGGGDHADGAAADSTGAPMRDATVRCD
jgi:hypothetical protein